MRHNRKLGFRVAGIRKSVHVELFDKHLRGDEQLHGAENAAVVREVAGAAAWKHMLVERVIYAHNEQIRVSQVDEMRNIKGKGGVAFAWVFAREPAVDPDGRSVKHGSKLNANGGTGPAFRNVELAL